MGNTPTSTSSRGADGLRELYHRRALADELGGPKRVQRQHDRGLLTARERIELLVDPGSLFDFGKLMHSGIPGEEERTFGNGRLLAFGAIDGRPVAVAASDATVKGGSGGAGQRRRGDAFRRIIDEAALPLFELAQGGGARITDILTSKFAGWNGAALGRRLAFPRRHAEFVAVLGNYYAPWSVAGADYTVMTRDSNLSISSPPVVQEATGEIVTPFELGGWEVQAQITGQVDEVVEDDGEAIQALRRTFSYLPATPWEEPPVVKTGDPPDRIDPSLRTIVPEQPNRAYNVQTIIRSIVDRDSFLEWKPEYGKNLVTGLARMDGHTIAIIASQPMVRAGALDIPGVNKIRRMLTLCEEFHLPLLSLLDVPGVLPTLDQEHNRLLTGVYGLAIDRLRTPTPKISLDIRKAYGYAMFGMSASDPEWYTFAWPSAQIAFMGPEPGVRVAFRREWETSDDPQAFFEERARILRRDAFPWVGAEMGYLEDVLDPAETRPAIIRALAVARARMRDRTWRWPDRR